MFLESCRLLKKFAFQSMLLLLGLRGGKPEEASWAKEWSPEQGEKKKTSQPLVEKAKSQRVADFWGCLQQLVSFRFLCD